MGFAEMGICVDHVEILKPACKFTLAMLADRADPYSDAEKTVRRTDGRVECWPSVDDIMHRTAQSRSTVLRQLKELENLGIIEVKKRYYFNESGQSRRASNRYIINLPDMLAGRFRAVEQGLSVKMTPKPENSKTPGQGLGVKLTPKQGLSVKNPQGLSVTVDTANKDQALTTNPSPPSPPAVEPGGEDAGAGQPGSAEPRRAEPDGSVGQESRPTPAAARRQPGAPDGAAHRNAKEPEDRQRSALSAPQALRGATGGRESESVLPGRQNGSEGSKTASSGAMGQARNHNDVIQADSALLADVLPEAMQAIPPRDQHRIAEAIRVRLDAGWTREQVRHVLGCRELPDTVRHLTALVMARFRDDMPVDSPPSWTAPPEAAPRRHWSKTLPSGRVVTAADLDMGQVAIDHYAARDAGAEYAQSSRWAFLDAVDVSVYLTR